MMKRKLSPMELDLQEMAGKVYVGKNDEEIDGGSIRIGHLEDIIIMNWIKLGSKINEEGYWEIKNAKEMRSWGFGLYELHRLEEAGLVKIQRHGRSRFAVRVSLAGEIPKAIEGVLR